MFIVFVQHEEEGMPTALGTDGGIVAGVDDDPAESLGRDADLGLAVFLWLFLPSCFWRQRIHLY